MAYSQAYRRFEAGREDIKRLLQLHREKAGPKRGRKRGVEVLTKSAIVLICAYWEAYIEDVCEEALGRLLAGIQSPSDLPAELKKAVAKRVREDKDESAPWSLAQDGWRKVCKDHISERLQKLNNPKSEKVSEVFRLALGIEDITEGWARPRMAKDRARRKLDDSIDLRGSIAHRGRTGATVRKKQCTDFLTLVEELVQSTDKVILKCLQQHTGRGFAVKSRTPQSEMPAGRQP